MSTPILATKLYIPPLRPKVVLRTHLIERLNEGLHHNHKLTLITAPAGFGKTTLLSEWVATCDWKVAWLSLDQADSDLIRFLTYYVAALQTIVPTIGAGVLGLLQAPQPLPIETILTALLNEIATIPDNFLLVLDDYHLIEARPVEEALAFLLDYLPPRMHLVIATREDPPLPLARLRARDQLTELRVTDLRFNPAEAAGFLKQVMGLDLTAEDIAALEERTEGWIAGLQLAALSLMGHQDSTSFIKAFTGSSRFIIDYLAEEVLEGQREEVRAFLMRTSVLERMCAPLCDAVLNFDNEAAALVGSPPLISSQAMLEKLEKSNLFIVPLDNERRWYRYHQLFADLLRQRLHQSTQSTASSTRDKREGIAELHLRASQWYEDNGLELEAFQHAAAANDVKRAERLIEAEGKGVPLHFRGAGVPVLNWLASLPTTVLDARPSLWMTYASALMMTGQHTAVEQKLKAAEKALQGPAPDDKNRDLIGRIASMRATLAIMQHDAQTILAQSRRALEYLHPTNLPLRTAANYTMGYAYQLQGERAAASQAYTEVIASSESFGPSIYTTAATICLGQLQEADNQLYLAVETYRQGLLLAGEPPRPIGCEAHLGLARIYYQWDDLVAAEQHGQQCLQLTRQMERVDTFAACGVLLARLKLARGDVGGAVANLAEAEQFVRQNNFMFRMGDVAAAQVLTLIRQGNLVAAARLAQMHELPLSQARLHLAQGDPASALAVLGPLRQQAEARGWPDERLKVLVLHSVALQAQGEKDQAVQQLGEVLALAEPGGFIRSFLDEGPPMAALLREAAKQDIAPNYVGQLLAAFGKAEGTTTPATQLLIEPLSERELEVLRLLGTELTGPELARELMVSLNTLRTHTKNIYSKLGVNNRRAAYRRALELDLL